MGRRAEEVTVALPAAEVERRLAYLELDARDVELLREAHQALAGGRDRFADAFYAHLRAFPETAALLDEARLRRLKVLQGAYFESLTAGDYGPDYVASRMRVGAVHQRIGVAPDWYIGAYRKYLGETAAMLREVFGADPARLGAMQDALVKVVMFDMGLTLETYFRADRAARDRADAELKELNARLEARVASRTAELERSNGDLESFSYSIAHDLRAPLRAMHGFAHLLLKEKAGQLDAEAHAMLGKVCASSIRMGELIDGLLGYARVGRAELHRVDTDLSALAEGVVHELRQGEPGREVAVGIEPGMRACVDPVVFHCVLANLLGNAWKYTGRRPDARIRFFSERVEAGTAYRVQDNGAGFDTAAAQRLFQPFERLHGVTEFGGTGIGLATVRRIVERHGGTVSGAGVVGEGATFSFTLPHSASALDPPPRGCCAADACGRQGDAAISGDTPATCVGPAATS